MDSLDVDARRGNAFTQRGVGEEVGGDTLPRVGVLREDALEEAHHSDRVVAAANQVCDPLVVGLRLVFATVFELYGHVDARRDGEQRRVASCQHHRQRRGKRGQRRETLILLGLRNMT